MGDSGWLHHFGKLGPDPNGGGTETKMEPCLYTSGRRFTSLRFDDEQDPGFGTQ